MMGTDSRREVNLDYSVDKYLSLMLAQLQRRLLYEADLDFMVPASRMIWISCITVFHNVIEAMNAA